MFNEPPKYKMIYLEVFESKYKMLGHLLLLQLTI